jgi:hypothetical protein
LPFSLLIENNSLTLQTTKKQKQKAKEMKPADIQILRKLIGGVKR